MTIRLSFILLLVLCYSTKLFAQSISLDYQDELLNEILLDLNDRYEVQISVNAELSNGCTVTIKKEFKSIDLAMQALAKKCTLELVKLGEVYAFRAISVQETAKPLPPNYLYQGTIREADSEEVLPFAVVITTNRSLVTDDYGRFSFISSAERETMLIRSLGYQDIDTVIMASNSLDISLAPRSMELEDVVVQAEMEDVAITNVGDGAGHIQLNNVNNNPVPGLSNNLIFNNLRLYPGIMAAGESIADFVIWGSYAGQNHVIYDGISLFNSWGINDDMGRVNPFMIKHVEVYKGGYNVPYGDRIGGVVLIDGKSGNPNQVESSISLTNQLVSGYLNIPLFNKTSTFQVAGRKSFVDPFNLSAESGDNLNLILPKYDYSDLHLKFSSQLGKNDYLELSTVLSTDSYKGRFRIRNAPGLLQDVNINSEQLGGSLKYAKGWANGGLSSFMLSQSHYKPELTTNYFVLRNITDQEFELRSELWNNPILEFRSRLTHTFPAVNNHQLQLNFEHVSNEVGFQSSGNELIIANATQRSSRFLIYGHDDIKISDNFSLQLGLKVDVPEYTDEVYYQPRINGQIDLSDRWSVHFGWGIYNQFISRNAVVDTLGNLTDIWQLANGRGIPVLESTHHVVGFGYKRAGFELSMEAYYKTSNGFSRYLVSRRASAIRFQGNGRSKGIDIFVKKHLKDHELWLSYSLAKADERFENGFRVSEYRLAPQSQRHELKAAAIFNLNPFRFSLTNVYGSGFSNFTFRRSREEFIPYWRTDIAFQYQFQLATQKVEAGFSMLNLFNRRNVRLNQSVNVPNGDIINTAGIPFTTTVYLNVNF